MRIAKKFAKLIDSPPKRIVLLHDDGLYQILGVNPAKGQPPSLLEGILINQAPAMVSLVKAKPRYYLYKPLMLPNVMGPRANTGGSFNPAQQ